MITTTVIGSYPKPDYLSVPDWFHQSNNDMSRYSVQEFNQYLATTHSNSENTNSQLERATHQVIEQQVKLGLDVVTDGEVRRENYIHYFCRLIQGFDFDQLTEIKIRNQQFTHLAPTITHAIRHPKNGSLLLAEWQAAQKLSSRPVKMTFPGPMTILDTVANQHYSEIREASFDLARAIQTEIGYLVAAGCTEIQIDEPVMARNPELALEYGILHLNLAFYLNPNDPSTSKVRRTVHICCGYPNRLNELDYPKADPDSYFKLIPKLDKSKYIQAISLEDAHRANPLELFSLIQQTELVLGVIRIAETEVESVESIVERVEQILPHLETKKLILAPDCGLGMLPEDICQQKLNNLVQAVKLLNSSQQVNTS